MRENVIIDQKTKYIRELFALEDNFLKQIREDCENDNRPINISSDEGKLLQMLIKISKYKKIIEIGTFYGYSTIWMAKAIPDDGYIITIEKEEKSYNKAKYNFKTVNLEKNIKAINGDAIEILDNLDSEFDMIFIDADKINYVNYLNWAEKHIRFGGLIVADNTLLSGAVYTNELPYRIRKTTKNIMKEFNLRLSNSKKYTSILLPSTDGITIALKEF